MADDTAASALGTPDPTGIPADIAAPAPTGDSTGIPATIAALPAGSEMPTPMGSTPGSELPTSTDPEIAAGAVHQNWLSRILDTVGSILGGDQTLTITKSPDGSIKVDHNPSTTSEKWGRVAQAALGGAAKGLAAGQGIGGTARAVAAGTEYGMQQPQQQLDQANQQAANLSAQQLRNAQNIALNQQIFKTSWDNAHLSQDYLRKQTTEALQQAQQMEDLHAVPIAMNIKNGAEVVQYGKTNPGAVQSHLGTDGSMLYNIPDGQGGVNVYQIPANLANRLTTDDDHWVQTVLDPKDGTKTIDRPDVTMAGQETYGQRATRRMALIVSNTNNIKDAQTAKTAASEAATKAGELTQHAPLVRAQTVEAQAKAGEASANAELARRQAAQAAGGYTPGQNPILDDTADGLASGRYLLSDLPVRTGKGQPTRQEQMSAANTLSQQKYGLPFNPTIIAQENKFASAPKTQAYLEGIDRMTGAHGDPGQLSQLLTLAQQAGIGPNAPLNDVKQAIRTRLGSQAADNFATLLTETQSNLGTLIGNPLLGSGESDQKLRTAQSAFGQNPTLDSLRGQVATVTDVLNRSRSNMAANNRYIQQRYGNRLSPTATTPNTPTATGPGATGNAATNTGQAARQIPQGAQIGRDPRTGQAVGYRLNGVWTPF
jgi:hypothetical protein